MKILRCKALYFNIIRYKLNIKILYSIQDLTNLLGINKDVASFYVTGFLFFFELAYLVAGYWGRKDLDSLGTPYDWTTPQCVLCLRFALEFLY